MVLILHSFMAGRAAMWGVQLAARIDRIYMAGQHDAEQQVILAVPSLLVVVVGH